MENFNYIVEQLTQNQVVAYPTEAVFGLGCNPNSEEAVRALLKLKQRSQDKGLILVAPTTDYFLPYIDESQLTETEWRRFEQIGENPITWIMPAKASVPRYLTGKFETIALRLCDVPAVKALCHAVGFPLTSTSANLTGQAPCRSAQEVMEQFGTEFPVLNQITGGRANPSEIRDIFTQQIFREG